MIKKWITIDFTGNLGEKKVWSGSYRIDPQSECFIVDWENKEIYVYGKKRLCRKEKDGI